MKLLALAASQNPVNTNKRIRVAVAAIIGMTVITDLAGIIVFVSNELYLPIVNLVNNIFFRFVLLMMYVVEGLLLQLSVISVLGLFMLSIQLQLDVLTHFRQTTAEEYVQQEASLQAQVVRLRVIREQVQRLSSDWSLIILATVLITVVTSYTFVYGFFAVSSKHSAPDFYGLHLLVLSWAMIFFWFWFSALVTYFSRDIVEFVASLVAPHSLERVQFLMQLSKAMPVFKVLYSLSFYPVYCLSPSIPSLSCSQLLCSPLSVLFSFSLSLWVGLLFISYQCCII